MLTTKIMTFRFGAQNTSQITKINSVDLDQTAPSGLYYLAGHL